MLTEKTASDNVNGEGNDTYNDNAEGMSNHNANSNDTVNDNVSDNDNGNSSHNGNDTCISIFHTFLSIVFVRSLIIQRHWPMVFEDFLDALEVFS